MEFLKDNNREVVPNAGEILSPRRHLAISETFLVVKTGEGAITGSG